MSEIPDNHKPPHRKGPRISLVVQFLVLSFIDILKPVKKINAPNPVLQPDRLQVWMVGHATMLVNFYGTTILTDPVFGNWLPFPRRIVGPGLRIDQLPPIDIILQSHVHWDHFHIRSVKKIASKNTTLITARECSDLVEGMEFKDVIEKSAGDRFEHEGITFSTHQPHHWGQRVPWEKVKRGHNAYVLEKNGTKIFFSGDSGYGPVFQEVGASHEIDLALLPIGAYNPKSFRKVHMNPEDALKAKADLGAKRMIPFHFGTFRLSKEAMDEPATWLTELAETQGIEGVEILHNGETYEHH